MAIFVALFEDDISRAEEVRRRYMTEHLDFLHRNASAILAAGPLKLADGKPAGGLWIVETPDQGQVETLIREDPFWPTGLRLSVRVLAWNQVCDGGLRTGAKG